MLKFRLDTVESPIQHRPDSQRIIDDLMVQGQDVLTPHLQQRMINIITGKQNLFSKIHNFISDNVSILEGLKHGKNPENGDVRETDLKQLLVLCHEHRDEKSFSPEQYAFLQGYLAALWNIQGNSI